MAEIRVMREDLLPPGPPPRRHLISIRDLSRDDVERLLATARSFERSLEREMKKHPTQALLDLYTIQEEFQRFDGLHVAIVGDVLHSRVARSNVQALVLMGARVTLVGPPALLPRGIEALGCETSTDIAAIGAADVVYVLRMQRERMQEGANYVPSLREYTARWGVTPERLRPGQKVMHPGPMNRGVEIDPVVADAADALIETQVRAGLVTRMAVLYDLLTTGPAPVKTPEPLEVA